MKLKITRVIFTNGRVFKKGAVEEMDDKRALSLIRAGLAEPIIETAVKEKPEKKVAKKKTSKKKAK